MSDGALVFSDLHLEEKSADACFEVLAQIPRECDTHGVDRVVFTGDFFMVRHTFVASLLVRARAVLATWRPRGIKRVDIVPGNHDQFSRDGRNLLEIFGDLPGFRVHTEPFFDEDAGEAFMPWRFDGVQPALEALAAKSPRMLFAHLAIRDSLMNNTKRDEDGLAASVLHAFPHVIMGHYHAHQAVTSTSWYVGSPYQTSYAEAGQEKGYMIAVPGEGAVFLPWELSSARRHFKIVVDADHPGPISLDGVDPSRGDKLWIVCKGQMAASVREHVQSIVQKAGIEADRIEIDLQPVEERARLKLDAGDNLDSLAQRFVQAQDVDESYKTMLMETWRRIR